MSDSLSNVAKRVLRRIEAEALLKKSKPLAIKSGKLIIGAKSVKDKKGLTLTQLLKNATDDRISNSIRDDVTIVAFRIGGKPKGSKIFSKSLTYDNSGKKERIRPHKHWITKHSDDLDKKFNSARLLVTCDCEDAMYTWEYALTHHGAATIMFGNGDPPVKKNPRLYPGICKHIYVILNYIKKAKV